MGKTMGCVKLEMAFICQLRPTGHCIPTSVRVYSGSGGFTNKEREEFLATTWGKC